MKNILYIGPYKYNNCFGICARNLIRTLETIEDSHLFTKHIFLNNPYDNQTIVNYQDKRIDPLNNHFDIVIQHAPIGMVSPDIDLSKINICIPIMDYTIDITNLDILNKFDKVIVDDYVHSKILSELNIKHILMRYELDKVINTQYYFNCGYHNFNKKFYYISKYKSEHSMIQKIIISFLLAFRSNNDISLILFLLDDDIDTTKKAISEMLSGIYKKIGYETNTPQVKYIVDHIEYDKLHAMHQFGDYNISLYDNYDSGLNTQLAKLYNKPLINISDINYIKVPYLDNYQQNYNTILSKYSVLTSSLIDTMKKLVTNNIKSESISAKSLQEILCS